MGISKIEAAERQLDAAIRLFFADEDWIAVHTLAAASRGILWNLAEQRGSLAWDMLNESINPEKRKDFWSELSKIANFFKHANQDPDDYLEDDNHIVNKSVILSNCVLFADLARRGTYAMAAFISWYAAAYPGLIIDEGLPPIFSVFKRLAAELQQQDLSRAEQLAFWRVRLEQQSQPERER